ncbi:MAG: type II toxin-antitoxin system RelE/ParE family toxin [Acidobacteria bacterium]|nr:type II toxin-antitoxin system RelE/ParE family toxin [Acidobacteriota bacterium]
MDRRVVWTAPALQDVEEAAAFIARDSPRYAAAVAREAQEAAGSLRRFAARGRVVPEFRHPGVRELFVRKFRLIYELTPDAVFILAFIHGARELGRIWGATPEEGER